MARDQFPVRHALVIVAIVLALPTAWALFSYGTLRPCEMVKQEARAFVMQEMTAEMKKPTSNSFEQAGRNIGMAMAAVMIGPMTDAFTSTMNPWQCARAVVRLNTNRDAAMAELPARDAAVRRLVLSFILVFVLATPALAQDRTRVDLYDAKSRREGYAIIDRERGTVDTFDKNSARTGYGKVAPDGKLDLYRPDRTRAGTATPQRPKR